MDKVKQWKPGQLITINGAVYRVVKNIGCFCCAFTTNFKMCDKLCNHKDGKLPRRLYLKKLKER